MTKLEKILLVLALALVVILAASLTCGCGGSEDSAEKSEEEMIDRGIVLIKTYSGVFTPASSASNDRIVQVPEIKGRPGLTFVLAYWTISEAPSLWTPCSDGWLDDAEYYASCWIDWTHGDVTFTGFSPGSYLYRVDVYGEL